MSSEAQIPTVVSFCIGVHSVGSYEKFQSHSPGRPVAPQRTPTAEDRYRQYWRCLAGADDALLKVDKEHADLRISKQITHRIEHAVTIVTRKDDGLTIDNTNKPGDRRPYRTRLVGPDDQW
jgi:hypothetical protein